MSQNKRVIATASIDRHEELFSLAQSNLERYAKLYNYEISKCSNSLDPSRPVAWTKLLHILQLMEDYEEIFWIDADAIILDSTVDISTTLQKETDLGWVFHEYNNQIHPNSGVMFIRVNSRTRELFNLANNQRDLDLHPWWDQAALMRVLGIESELQPVGVMKNPATVQITQQKLSNEWNSIRQDAHQQPRIRHFAGDDFWLRKLLMAEYSNPGLGSRESLNEVIDYVNRNLDLIETLQLDHETLQLDHETLQLDHETLQLDHETLQRQLNEIYKSRTWTLFSFWRLIRNQMTKTFHS